MRMMRKLVFYSDQILPAGKAVDERMLDLLGKKKPVVGYIPSSSDPDRIWFSECKVFYSRYDIDLDLYFGLGQAYDSPTLDLLFSCDAIHLSGGNTFQFLQRLKVRGLLKPLRQYVLNGGVLIGVSAGSIIMTPNIRASLLCGDEPVQGVSDYSGLGLVDFAFVPHFGVPNVGLPELIEYSKTFRTTVYGCPDGSGIVIDGDQIECIGEIVAISDGAVQ